MGKSYYPTQDYKAKTWTVGELLTELQKHDPALEVCFACPINGAFGPGHQYTVDGVEHVQVPRKEQVIPEHEHFDEEDGTSWMVEAETQVWKAWEAVVIR